LSCTPPLAPRFLHTARPAVGRRPPVVHKTRRAEDERPGQNDSGILRFASILRGALFAILVLAACSRAAGAEQSPKATATDSLQQRYQAARTFTVAGDTDRAAKEYRA